MDSSATEAIVILWHHTDTLSQCLINPVKVSQLLFSERCISEETLDVMETMEGIMNEKKTTLLSAIHTAVSSDHKKLKVVATILSKFEETKVLSERIISEYSERSLILIIYFDISLLKGQKFPEDQTTIANVQEVVMTGHSSCEDHASDILRCHYGTLSQCLQYPVQIAELLHGEGVISDDTLTISTQPLMSLLKAVRGAVHSNYHNLKVFASVLQRFTDNIQLGDVIMNDYSKL